MTILKTPPPDVLEYLQSVRATLADLPPEERDELMVDVETALLEASEEHEGPLAAHLGPPETFAADLRAAAGLEDPPAPVPPPAAPPAPPAAAAAAAARLRAALAAAREDPRAAAARRIAGELAPIWWVARAFVAFAAVALALGARTSVLHPWMPVAGDRTITFLVLGATLAVSLWLGLRRRGGRAMLAANVILALIALPLALHLANRDSEPAPGWEERAATRATERARALRSVTEANRAIRRVDPATGALLSAPIVLDRRGRPLVLTQPQPIPPRARTTAAPPAAVTPARPAPRGTTTPGNRGAPRLARPVPPAAAAPAPATP